MKLKMIMDEKGLDQSALAKIIGVTRQQISIWMTNPASAKLPSIAKIANAVDIDPKELIGY